MSCDDSKLTVLVDADNFYVSCERIFRPDLRASPVVVLSNNDGCVVARSPEVKEMGVKMGTPYFQVRELPGGGEITAFSSNYELYGDISARIMQVLGGVSPKLEPYSIDEAFLEVDSDGAEAVGREIIATCRDWVGVPVKVGMARTKTLAKIAAEWIKREKPDCRCRRLTEPADIAGGLEQIPLEDVWGVGQRTADKLRRCGIRTPAELAAQPADRLRKKFDVNLARTALELNGVACFDIETHPPPRQSLCCSKSFGRCVGDYPDLLESVVAYAAEAAAKLRRQKQAAQSISVFILTDRFNPDAPQYANSACVPLVPASSDTGPIVKAASRALARIFKPGFHYKKSGVLLNDLVSDALEQEDLFQARDPRAKALSQALDAINAKYGPNAVALGASAMKNRKWTMTRRRQSPKYTTRWTDLMRVG